MGIHLPQLHQERPDLFSIPSEDQLVIHSPKQIQLAEELQAMSAAQLLSIQYKLESEESPKVG